MFLKLYRNARELWEELKDEVTEHPRPDSVLIAPKENGGYEHVKSLKQLDSVQFPVVVRTHVDYESVGPSTGHHILTHEEVMKIKKEVMEDVISPYLDITTKRKKG